MPKRGLDQEEAPVVPPPKKTRGRVKLENEFIEDKLRRRKVFSVRKIGVMKTVANLTTLTGTQALLLIRSETGHLYKFATDTFKPMITSEAGTALIQSCLDSLEGPRSTTTEESSSGFQIREQQQSHTSTTPSPSQCDFSLSSSDDETEVTELSLDVLPGTTTTSSSGTSNLQSTSVPTTTSPTIQESTSLEVEQLHSHTPGISLPPMEDHAAMDPWNLDPSLQTSDSETDSESSSSTDDETESSSSSSSSSSSTDDETESSSSSTGTSSSSTNQSTSVSTTTTSPTIQEQLYLEVQQEVQHLEVQQLHSHVPGSSLPRMEHHGMNPWMDPWMDPSASGTAITQEEELTSYLSDFIRGEYGYFGGFLYF